MNNTLTSRGVKGKITLENNPWRIASVFKPKLMTFVRNVAFFGKFLKTRVQEAIRNKSCFLF